MKNNVYKRFILSLLVFMGMSVNLFGAFEDNNFTIEDLNNTTMYEPHDENNSWQTGSIVFYENNINFSDDDINRTYIIDSSGYIVLGESPAFYIKIIDQNSSALHICEDDNLTRLVACNEVKYWFFDKSDADSFVQIKNNQTSSQDDFNSYGDNASKISGSITLPTGATLASEVECSNNPYCNTIRIELRLENNEHLGFAKVEGNESQGYEYNLYFRELNETLNTLLIVHTFIDGLREEFYLDFGDDNTSGGTGNNADSFISRTEVQWIQQSADSEIWIPVVNPLSISTSDITMDLNLVDIDRDKYILEGTVKVPENFTPGENFDENNVWLSRQTVVIIAINNATGNQYRTNIGIIQVEGSDNVYSFKLRVPNNEGNYTIRIEKMTDTGSGSEFVGSEFVEMYLNDGGDHQFGNDILKSATGISFQDIGEGIWIPDTSIVGYFTINSSENGIVIDISDFGNNFYKIEGSVVPQSEFDLSNHKNNMYIEIIDAKTGGWLGSTMVTCNSGSCTYSVILGDSLSDDGYIIKVNQEYIDQQNWENSWWKSFYYDVDNSNILDQMNVGYRENIDTDTGVSYMVPDVNPYIISENTTVNIDFSSYIPPVTYTVSGIVSGIPENAQWVNVRIYTPITYNSINTELKNGSFELKNVKAGKYLLEINYEAEDSNGNNRYYHYIIDNNDEAIDGRDVLWIPYDNNGTSLEDSLISGSLSGEAYWAPRESESQKFMIDVAGDMALNNIDITQIQLFDLIANLNGVGADKNVNFSLFVPNKPIGKWGNTTSNDAGDTSVTLRDLKARDDYQLQIWIEGLGEFWYDENSNTLSSDVYWVGKQNNEVCDDWKEQIWTCDWDDFDNPIEWGPNISGFSIDSTQTLNLTIPNDRRTITAILALGNVYADQTVDVNVWQHNGGNYVWGQFTADGNGDIVISMSVKQGSNYRMEVYIPQSGEGYVVDLGDPNSLITNQNSWSREGAWGPKASTLIDMNSDVNLGTLNPPTLNTLTFTIENLDANEEIFIDLEKIDESEWYGNGNVDWLTQTPTYTNTVSIKVPSGDYRVMIHPQNHKGGLINNGNNDVNDTIVADANITSFNWDWDKADKISVNDTQAYTISLPNAADLKSINGTVNLGAGNIEAGWIHAWNNAGGNGAEVRPNGTFEIRSLAAGTYTLEYWAWNEDGDFINIADVNVTNDVAGLVINKPTTVHTLSGDVTNINVGADKQIYVLLLNITDTDNSNGINAGDSWEVIADVNSSLSNNQNYAYEFTVPPALANHSYAVAVGTRVRNMTTGATTFTLYEATESPNNAVVLDDINNTTNSVSITVTETIN